MSSELQPIIAAGRQRPEADSVERALNEVGDRWTFLILREAFFGVRRFDDFQRNTGAAKNIVSDRLKRLLEFAIFEKRRYSDHANRFEYRLTEKGRDLYPMIVMLMAWGDRWLSGETGAPLELIHKPCGRVLDPFVACAACGEEVNARETDWRSTE